MINLKNKSVVVTGGTRGIGAEITKSFLKHDAHVFVLARQKPKKLIQAKGNKAIFIECNIRDIDSLDFAVKEINSRSKSIDVLGIYLSLNISSSESENNPLIFCNISIFYHIFFFQI